MTGGIPVRLQTSSEQMPKRYEAGEGYTEHVLLLSRRHYCNVGFWKKKKMWLGPNTNFVNVAFFSFLFFFF